MPERTIIVGGGLAGLAAAVALTQHGQPVTLLESRKKLGGRASSFTDPGTGETIDNCQHVSLGCCTNFTHFCQTVGVDQFLRTEPELTFIGPGGEVVAFSESNWPAPFHLVAAFRRLTYLTRTEQFLLARALRRLARQRAHGDNEVSFLEWLEQNGQTPRLQAHFWHIVLVSALSESLDRIDVGYARKVFVDSFLANRAGWRMRVPTISLEELFDRHVAEWLQSHGADVRVATAAGELQASNNAVTHVQLADGTLMDGGDFVLAVPHFRIGDVTSAALRNALNLNAVSQIETAPISSVHLWYDREVTDQPHAALVGRMSQWMFNRTALWGREDPDGHCYQIVISASRDVVNLDRDEALATVQAEFESIWPAACSATLRRARLVTERRAVFSATPGVDRLRPPQQTAMANLQLAGDWTQTGWPATMEGAVRSGYLAAENILARRGLAGRLLQPDLPVSSWSHWLLGLNRPNGTEV